MKKILLAIFCLSMLSGCFIFRKKDKYGCPGGPDKNGKTVGQRILDGEDVKQPKYRIR